MTELGSALLRWKESPTQMVRELFGVEPDAWQREALDAFPHTRRLAMRACAGPGKGLRLSAEIDTPSGRVRWGDLRPGHLVFAEDGSPCRVERIFPLGVQPIYRVSFSDGSSCDVTGEHLWKVRGRTERRHWKAAQKAGATGDDGGYRVLTTEEIIARGVMTVNRSGPAKQFEIPHQGAAQFPRADLPFDPYALGVWLGDGTRGEPAYDKPYPEVEHEIVRRGYEVARKGNRVRLLKATEAFRAIGDVHRMRSHERWIPDIYRHASVQQRTDLLCGLMDTDGCIGTDSHMEYDTTSKQLAEDVVWLVRSLGGVSFIKAAIKKGWYRDAEGHRIDCRNCYRVSVTLPFNPFRIPHKRDRWHMPQRRYLTRYIASIERIADDEAMCIQVDHPSRCHLANDFIVTHNTWVLAMLGWNFLLTRPHPMIGASSVNGSNLKSGLWAELARWRNRAPLLQRMFEMTDSAIFNRDARETWKLEARTWAKDADADQIGNALAGLHADYIMWLLDETGDYPQAVLPVIEGIFSGSPTEAHIVQAGNPTRRSGPLWHASSVARDLWKLITITADPDDPKRTPRVSVEVAREQIRQYGRENPWVKIRIFGEFPDADFNALISADEVEASFKRAYREHEIGPDAPLVFGVDVARFGDDQSVIYPRRGIQGFAPYKFRNVDSTQGAGRLVRLWEDQNVDGVFVDNAGMGGGGWIDAAIRLGKTPVGIDFSGRPHSDRFYNRRAEMYFDLVEWIRRGGALVEDAEVLAALSQTNYSFHRDSPKMILEPKDSVKVKLGYSPDAADALCLTFAEPVTRRATGIVRNQRPYVAQTEWNPFKTEVNAANGTYDPFDPNRR